MSTQIIQAKQGIITPEMHEVAYKEKVDADWLRNEIALGLRIRVWYRKRLSPG